MKNSKLFAFYVFIYSVLVVSPVIFSQEHPHGTDVKKEATTQKTIEGEVLDMVCFMSHNAQGKKHKSCAQKCIKEGAPVGLLTTDGQVFLVIENHNKKEPFKKLKNFAAEKVKVTGTISIKNGVQSIEVENVEKI